MRNNIRGFIIGGFLASGLGALAVNIPFTFSAGSPIKASDINANFSSIKTAVDKLETAPVQTDDTLKGSGASARKLGLKIPLNITVDTTQIPINLVNTNTSGTGMAIASENFALDARSTGIAISGNSANRYGVYGTSRSASINTPGVLGDNLSTVGQVVGVYGVATASPIGTGVGGVGSVTGGYFEAKSGESGGFKPTGVFGVAKQNFGTGVYGNGGTWGGQFVSNGVGIQIDGGTGIVVGSKDGGTTLYMNQKGTGALINGIMPNSKRFIVQNDGTVETSGNVIANGVSLTSDRHAKTNFSSVNALEVLKKVSQLPISRWNYKTDASSVQHLGPMAQDFHAAFGLNGSDDKHLSAVDVQGVTLAAIQGLNQKLERENASLRASLAALEARLSTLERR